mmetsp:Transcript_24250/g.37387  ORF Transcript_24250/g.37387 Transcript_24250/m.37387 type:complete len:196 (+) Transcript_24250:514-1101(+)
MTANLDGERNLKPKIALGMIQKQFGDIVKMGNSNIELTYQEPSKDIYYFNGTITNGSETEEVGLNQFLPAGSNLQNSQTAYALVLYTGVETKLGMNEGMYSLKTSSTSQKTNFVLIINFFLIVFLIIVSSQLGNRIWLRINHDKHFYIYPEGADLNTEEYTFKSLMSFFLLLNMNIPLDLAVIIVISKLIFTYFM